jgi:hypothetical protein
MTFSDETLMAYADGELDAQTRGAVEAAMAADPEVARRIVQYQALRSRLRSAFDPVLAEPLPERLLAAARGSAPQPRPGKVSALPPASARWSWPQWGALAASLVLGVLLGPWLVRAPGRAPLVTHDGTVLAAGALARALSEQLASDQSASAPVQIGVSFRSHGGDYCRSFVLREKNALAGLACHDHGAWRLEALAASESAPAAAGEYRTAAAALPPAVAGTVDALIAGEPLDAKAEAAARDRGWSH